MKVVAQSKVGRVVDDYLISQGFKTAEEQEIQRNIYASYISDSEANDLHIELDDTYGRAYIALMRINPELSLQEQRKEAKYVGSTKWVYDQMAWN